MNGLGTSPVVADPSLMSSLLPGISVVNKDNPPSTALYCTLIKRRMGAFKVDRCPLPSDLVHRE
jgi:NCAIR mutase (PurE)-related protein